MLKSKLLTSTSIDCVYQANAICGECPRWSSDEGVLYWTDIDGKTLNRLHPSSGLNTVTVFNQEIGSFSFRERGGMICAAKNGFAFCEFGCSELEHISNPETTIRGNRFNDGRCDPAGRFWAGTMNLAVSEPTGSLYCIDENLVSAGKAHSVIVSNGLAFSPDAKTLYWSDSRRLVVYAFNFDLASGNIKNQRVFLKSSEELGRPDGAAIDVDGCYWSAGYGAGTVVRYTPKGMVDRVVRFPVTQVTMCAFGGPRLDTMFVTTARLGLSEQELGKQPLAGAIFAFDPKTTGIPEPKFAG